MLRAFAIVSVERVADARGAAPLFARKFGHPLPDSPAHYVATYHGPGDPNVVGYVHVTAFDAARLCGGLCVDERVYRRMDPAALAIVGAAGAIARMLMTVATADCRAAHASFAYTGNRQSQIVLEDVGYGLASPPYLLAFWHDEAMGANDRDALIGKVRAKGPF